MPQDLHGSGNFPFDVTDGGGRFAARLQGPSRELTGFLGWLGPGT
jgi:hypothetical protein